MSGKVAVTRHRSVIAAGHTGSRVVHAAHQLAARFPDGQIFLELNAHTPGQRPADPIRHRQPGSRPVHHRGEAGALSELGVLQRATRDYTAAADSLTRAIELTHEIGELGDEAEAINNLGDVLLDTSAADDAHDKYARALAITTEIGSSLEEASALEGVGRYLLDAGKRAAGKEMLQRSLAVYEGIGSPNSKRVRKILDALGP